MFSTPSPEHIAIGTLFTLYHALGGGVIRYLIRENSDMRRQIRVRNEADLKIRLSVVSQPSSPSPFSPEVLDRDLLLPRSDAGEPKEPVC